MKIELTQRSPEWIEYRKDRIGASEIGTIMGLNPYETPLQWWEGRKGLLPEKEVNSYMQYGIDHEDEAREWAIAEYGIEFVPAVYQSDKHPFMIASLDGISSQGKIILEIKCSKKALESARKGKLEEVYIAQVQHQMYCCGASTCVFAAWYENDCKLISIVRDDAYIAEIIKAATKAKEVWLDQNTPPDGHAEIEINDTQLSKVKELLAIRAQIKAYQSIEKSLKKQIENMGDDGDCILTYNGDAQVKMTRVLPSAKVDYKALCEGEKISEAIQAKYKKPESIGYYLITDMSEDKDKQ